MDIGIGVGIALFGIALGASLAVLGIAYGIGRIGGQALDGISRQPEASGKIQTAMIVASALIEGAGLFALAIMFLMQNNLIK